MEQTAKIKKILKNNNQSITESRLKIFETLANLDAPISVARLADVCSYIDKATVYRTVDLFEKIGIVHRVWTGFKSRIELSEDFSAHHHHFTCLKCGKTINIQSPKLEKDLHSFEDKYGFKLTHHSLELSGYCSVCRVKSI